MKEKVYRAGLIPFYINNNDVIEMKFMVPTDQKYGGSDPQFAKGRIEKNENHEESAIREAKEELGLKEDNVEWIYYLGQFLGRTHIHICEVKSKNDFDEPHYETESTHWMTLEDFMTGGRELHRPVIREAHMTFELIKKEEEAGGEDFEEIEVN
jgi:8-oxo-dGTP pyrophosphatase MutT (NUDIX family)